MSRRLDIELTSVRGDGTWTWRAAGAKEPRGAIDAKLLEVGAKVGDVVRVEASFDMDGITIVSVLAPRERSDPKGRIEIVGAPNDGSGSVTTELVSRRRGVGRDWAERDPARTHRDEKRPRPGRPPRPEAAPDSPRRERPARVRPKRASAEGTEPSRRRVPERAERVAERPRRARPPRFAPGTKHRDDLLSSLPAEQTAVAEQLALGGMPAIRRAVAEARGSGGHGGEAMIALAEQLLPDVRRAMWLDRAEAAVAQIETISLRDLRTTVVGATPRDEAGRAMLTTLREALSARVNKIRTNWEQEIGHALQAGRILQALRLSSRAPDTGARLPAPLAKPLADAASAALDAATPPDRWLALLEAAAGSPVRLSVKPAGMPTDESGALRQRAAAWAGRIPALAPMLGLTLPPPPRPVKSASPPERTRRREPRAAGRRRQAPPVDALPGGESAEAATDEAAEQAPLEVSADGAEVADSSASESADGEAAEQALAEVRIDSVAVSAASESEMSDEAEKGVSAVPLAQDSVVDKPPSDSVDQV
jgi:hypothetical protein